MATIKSFTDLQQSKKLAEILPLESADMMYQKYETVVIGDDYGYKYRIQPFFSSNIDSIPCWSLAALLSVLPDSIYENTDEYSQLEFSKNSVAYHDLNDGIKIGSLKGNLIDACYELILKLHKLNLL